MSKKISAVIFDRVSSEDQRDGYSLQAQRANSLAYAKKNSFEIVKTWSVDESASKEDDRVEFFEMLEYVKSNKVPAVIFDKVDRACRGMKSATLIDDLMESHGVKFHFTRDNLVIDKDSPPQEKLRFKLGIILAEYYVNNLVSEIKKGIEAKRNAGVWSGKAPFGYDNVEKNGRKAIGVNEVEFSVCKEAFNLYATGNYGYEELAKLINSRIPDAQATKRLVESIIPNPFYYGMMKIKGNLYPGSHEPMITKELFDACQKIRGIRAANSRSSRKGFIAKPLMGLIKCEECGHSVTGESQVKKSGKVHIYYRCANHKCAQYKKRINQDDLFNVFKKAFEPFKKWTPKATKFFIESIHASLGDLELYTQKMTGELAVARMELKKRIEILSGLKNDSKLSQAEYDAAVAIPLKLLEDNSTEIQSYQEADLATFQKGCQIIQLFQKAYDYMHLDGNELDKVKLIKTVLSNIRMKDRTIYFNYEKPLDVLLDLPSVPVWWRRGESNPRP
jgi:site-specific DNA recombinase